MLQRSRDCHFINNVYRTNGLQPYDWSEWTIYSPNDIPHHISTWAYKIYSGAFFDFHKDNMNTARKWILNTLFECDGRTQTPVVYSTSRLQTKRDVMKELDTLLVQEMVIPIILVSTSPPMHSPSTQEFVRSFFCREGGSVPFSRRCPSKGIE